jgi:hypothetical protein
MSFSGNNKRNKDSFDNDNDDNDDNELPKTIILDSEIRGQPGYCKIKQEYIIQRNNNSNNNNDNDDNDDDDDEEDDEEENKFLIDCITIEKNPTCFSI